MGRLYYACCLIAVISLIWGCDPGSTGTQTAMHDVVVTKSPAAGGQISPTADTTVENGEPLTLQAFSADKYYFSHWAGDVDSTSDNPLTITVDKDYTLAANFQVKHYELTVNKQGEGTVGEQVVSQKSKEYAHGTVVELTAQPEGGWVFKEWKGAATGAESPVQVTVDQPKEVTAIFEKSDLSLEIISGDGQHGVPGSDLPNPLGVKVVDQNGQGISDIAVNYTITEGDATLSAQEATTNKEGVTGVNLSLGESYGTVKVKARPNNVDEGIGVDSVKFTAVAESELGQWLDQHPSITDVIHWQKPTGVVNYSNWTEARKAELDEMYFKVVNRQLDMDNYPPENHYDERGRVGTYIAKEDAWELYLMNIANSLAVERNNWVNWSLLSGEYSQDELESFFHSRSMFEYREKLDGLHIYEPIFDNFYSRVLAAQPQFVMEFFESEDILSSTRKETIYRLVDWSAVNLLHYLGSWTMENAKDHWNYAGAVPVDRIINGTDRAGDQSEEIKNWTPACHGTNQFYISILKTLNIPVEYERRAGHATPYFPLENIYLSHGDDPYNAFYARKPAIHPQELLIDATTWQDWFGHDNAREVVLNNIGRQALELGVEHLSHYLLQLYCGDKEQGNTKKEGKVFDALSRYYTLSELEEMGLWEKMDNKLSDIGGCENINRERVPWY